EEIEEDESEDEITFEFESHCEEDVCLVEVASQKEGQEKKIEKDWDYNSFRQDLIESIRNSRLSSLPSSSLSPESSNPILSDPSSSLSLPDSPDNFLENFPELPVANDTHEDYFMEVVACLEEKFKEFKIDARIVNILKGPVVDTFELELGAGVRISKVTAITEDLALALHGVPIRMIYPMKERSTIGIEIPHDSRKTIFLDEVLSGT
ncbi:MAG: hypothetical protein HQK53_20095, partial [Oligoflexia bacterium]|nr:hypothetical protein [Oligoflexia bacterium]